MKGICIAYYIFSEYRMICTLALVYEYTHLYVMYMYICISVHMQTRM